MPVTAIRPLVAVLALLAACDPGKTPAANTPPTLEAVDITADPAPATSRSTLTCAATAADADGDPLTTSLTWRLESDGAALGEGDTLVLSPEMVEPDDVVVCTAVVSDPDGATAEGSAAVQLGNEDPALAAVGITADTDDGLVYNDSTLTCTATATDPDDRSVAVTYAWRNETTGDTLGSDARLTLTPDLATPGDALGCTVLATDADGGEATDSVGVTVANRAPDAGTLVLSPASPSSQDDVTCTVTGASDPDADGVQLTQAWQRDGAADAEGDTIAAPHAVGSVLTCVVTATDDHGAETTITADAAVANTAPTVDGVTVTPAEARVGDVLTCAATASDVDGADPTIAYRWSDGSVGETYTVLDTDDPGDVITCTATATDAGGESASDTAAATVQNTDPVLAGVSISPASAHNDDTLTCAATATDADGDLPAVSYAWTASAAGSLGTGSSVDLSATAVTSLETVTCTATATDPDGGTTNAGADLTVSNRDPSVAVALSPSSGATRSDTLECTATTADEDGDSVVVSYSWTVDGVAETASGTTATASRLAGVFQKDQLVTCTATADDAKGGTASAVASTTIGNTPPTVSTPSLTPAIAYTNDTITANVTTSDDDGDSVGLSYDWMVDGVSVQTGSDNTLDGTTWFDKGQDVRVTVTADDGDDTTDAASPTRTVANTPPAAPVVAIDPADPVEGEDLYCAVTTASTDADGDTVTYRMGWTVDAVAYSSALTTTWADDTADGLDTRAGEVWECTATPTDGDDDGGTASDAVRVEADTCEVGGSWSSSTLVGGRETQGYRVYDINGDGHDDLAFNNQLDQNIDFYMGDGSGTYTGFSDYHVGRSGGGFDFGDVDNDGDLDLVISNQDYSRIGVLSGTGAGTFSSTRFFSQGSFPQDIALLDADNDGNLDLFVTLRSAGCTAVRFGDGSGNFSGASCILTTRGNIRAIDVDGDGHGELVQRPSSSAVVLHRFDASGNISSTTTLDTSLCSSVSAPSVYDLDRDGDPDILVPCTLAATGSTALLSLKSDGAGSFDACVHTDGLVGGGSVGDFNADGLADYIRSTTCSYCGSTHTIYLNE